MLSLADLRTERLVDPIGLGSRTPRLSWRIEADAGETDVIQEGWQVQVDNGEDVAWETGRVDGREQSVAYDGPTLGSRDARWWRARVWTSAGETGWSDRATFELGLLEPSDWSAEMITASASTPVVRFAQAFEAPDVASARLYVTAHGAFTTAINGVPTSDEVLAPGWTTYHRRLACRTHDVTDLVRDGANTIDALVAPAWFSGRFGLRSEETGSGYYGQHVGLLAQLEITTRSGDRVVVVTDPSWIATSTPFLLAEIYDGETYDARLAGGDGEPAPVTTVDLDPTTLVAPAVPPVRRTETIAAVERTVVGDGVLQLDFGQNLVGFMKVTLRGLEASDEVVMRHAEVLGPDRRLYTIPLRSAKATDTYVARGDAVEIYEPTFTFHGFRYAEISGVDPGNVEAEAIVVHSDIDRIGTFECSDDLVNRLHANVVWGQRGNFLSVPTDCPQRDERLGWTGDAQVFSSTASFLFDCETFWENWLADLAADQRDDGCVPCVVPDMGLPIGAGTCGWGDAAVVVPMTTYEAYGDATVLRRALPSMIAWVDYVFTRLDDDQRWSRDFQFGDWLDPDAPTAEPWKAKARFDLVATAYAVRSSDLLGRAASILGEDATAKRYRDRASLIRASWWQHYGERALTTQTGCALALEFDLVPAAERRRFGDALVERIREADTHLATGFLGTPLLLPALTRTGHLDVAYEVLQQDTCPSWLYPVAAGATTIWERWDALRPDGSVPNEGLGGQGAGMVSFTHYAYGAVADWLHGSLAGHALDPDEPGYRHVIVAPKPGGRLIRAGAELRSRYGRTAVSWRIDDGTFSLDVAIPPNASATVTLPDATVTEIGSGTRSFSCPVQTGPAARTLGAT